MFKHHSPFKTLYSILTLLAIGMGIVLAIFALNWLMHNIYTLIWIFLVLGCLVWLADSIYMSFQDRITNLMKQDQEFPSEKYEG